MVSLVKLALHVLTGFWAQLVQWLGTVARRARYPYGPGGGTSGASSTGSATTTSRVRSSWEASCCFVLGLQGFLMAVVGENLQRIQRDVERRPLYYIDRELG